MVVTTVTTVVSVVVGRTVGIAVVGDEVLTGAGVEGDVHPAITIVMIRQTPIQIGVLLSSI
jgi:hypothetical protein